MMDEKELRRKIKKDVMEDLKIHGKVVNLIDEKLEEHTNGKVRCPHCGDQFDARGAHKHIANCSDAPLQITIDDVDQDRLKDFLDRPYLLETSADGQYTFYIPAFVDFQVGRLEGTTDDGLWKISVLDNTTKLLQEVPQEVRDDPRIDLAFDDRFKVRGNFLHYDQEHKDWIGMHSEVMEHLEYLEDTRGKIKPGHEFELLKDLIENGFDPYTPQPPNAEDMRHVDVNFELRDYQQRWVDHFLDHGSACFVGPTGSGKSFPLMWILDRFEYDEKNARKALIVEGRMTRDQWLTYFDKYAPRLREEVDIVTYASVDKLQPGPDEDFEYILVAADECHALPADTFAGAATLPAKHRIGASASPYREDDRTPYIFAFTGTPLGGDWDSILDAQNQDRHEIQVDIVEDQDAKMRVVDDWKDTIEEKRTLIFVDGLEFGQRVADALGLEFVSGKDTNQYDKIREAMNEDGACVVSRVGDHGLSIEGLEAILELDFLYGSRRQQIQRTGRLLHDDQGDLHTIVFTENEWDKHQKRVFSLLDRGFELQLPDGVEIERDVQETDMDIDTGNFDRVREIHERAERNAERKKEMEDMDPLDFLKNPEVKKEVQNRVEKADKPAAKHIKKAITLIAREGDEGMSHDELAMVMDVGKRTAQRSTMPFRKDEYGPSILKKKGRSPAAYYIDTTALDDIIEAKRKREEADDVYEEVFGDG